MCGVELVPVERLKPADYNPRRADAERLALVRLSLSRLGFLLPIVATPDGEILSGHQRHAVAMSMGIFTFSPSTVTVAGSVRGL